jgi:hypothetical protein
VPADPLAIDTVGQQRLLSPRLPQKMPFPIVPILVLLAMASPFVLIAWLKLVG